MKAAVGTKVEAYKSQCQGHIIYGFHYDGEITKVNKKSILVHLTGERTTKSGKEQKHISLDDTVRYTFWKTTSYGKDLYKSESKLYGTIEI